jgi:GT2 family glycosyltransferase
MASEPSVGVVLVSHNGLRFLDPCIDAVKATGYPRLEIVVVDNASTDGSVERLRTRHPDVTLLPQPVNCGFAEGSNIGIRHALQRDHAYVLLLNNDTSVDVRLVDALVSLADPHTLVAPKSYDWDGRLINSHAGDMDWLRGRLRERFFGRRDDEISPQAQEVGLADGSCLLVPAGAFHSVGLLDEAYFLYYEDWDFVLRARREGYRVLFQPAASLRHYERGTSGPSDVSPVTAYYTTRNRLRFMRKHAPSRRTYAVFLAYFGATRTLTILDYVRRGKWHLARWTLRGVADFVRGRTGPAPFHAVQSTTCAARGEPAPGSQS